MQVWAKTICVSKNCCFYVYVLNILHCIFWDKSVLFLALVCGQGKAKQASRVLPVSRPLHPLELIVLRPYGRAGRDICGGGAVFC